MLAAALTHTGYISGSTHNFYHYPARFSPETVRALVNSFSMPGDWILDCFMGGGTSAIESLTLGRRVLGVDLNSLAHFVAEVRTTPLTPKDEREVRGWALRVQDRSATPRGDSVKLQGVKNLPRSVEAFTAGALDLVDELSSKRRQAFARAALLRLGQWALESRGAVPRRRRLAERLGTLVDEMIAGMREFRAACPEWGHADEIAERKILLNRDSVGLGEDVRVAQLRGRVACVVTSPPYPGVHVLYHRWQYRGRRETSAPYWVAAMQDGQGASYYTLGGRSAIGVERYYTTLTAIFASIKPLLRTDAVVAQVVAFHDRDAQLPLFLRAMMLAGYTEIATEDEDRLWRQVPNRRWYNRIRRERGGKRGAGCEVLLLHQPIVS